MKDNDKISWFFAFWVIIPTTNSHSRTWNHRKQSSATGSSGTGWKILRYLLQYTHQYPNLHWELYSTLSLFWCGIGYSFNPLTPRGTIYSHYIFIDIKTIKLIDCKLHYNDILHNINIILILGRYRTFKSQGRHTSPE